MHRCQCLETVNRESGNSGTAIIRGAKHRAIAAQVRWSSCGDRLAAVGRGGTAATWRLDAPLIGGLAHADWLSQVWPCITPCCVSFGLLYPIP